MYQQTQRAEFQQKKFDSVNPKVAAPKNQSTVKTMPILDFFSTLINTEIERRYDNFNFEILPLDLAI
ncbi:hypothetical protein JCM19053_3855 [Vibrio sp. JCM 19053]|nr:hypothetical protein JCM19053_3855 [Vibrio sp. JCM 19053]